MSQSSIFIIKKTSYNHVLAQTHTSTQAPTCRRLPPSLVYQPHLEGSFNPLLSFTNLIWKGATTPWYEYQLLLAESFHFHTEGFNPQIHCRPRFINFQTGSNSFNTILHLSTNILFPLHQTEQWNHYNQNIRDSLDFRIDIQKLNQLWATIILDIIRAFI